MFDSFRNNVQYRPVFRPQKYDASPSNPTNVETFGVVLVLYLRSVMHFCFETVIYHAFS